LRRAIQRQIEDPISERMLMKEFRAGEIIVVDVELDPETNENMIVFRSVEGFTPPPMEMVDAGGATPAPTEG
jgi:ATP-dependent Clp protease ATP-binding subunit ClpC